MDLSTVPEIERAIDALTSQRREELYRWLDRTIRSPSTCSLKPTSMRGALTTASIAPWPTTEPEKHNTCSAGAKQIRNTLPCNPT